jgi:glycosyltransferase involved in cell wall biosynthesis
MISSPQKITMPKFKKQASILQVIPELEVGGAEKTTIEIALALKASGATPYVCSSGGRLVKSLEKESIPHFTLPVKSKNPLTILFNTYDLYKLIKKHDIKIIHARSRAPAWSCFLAAKWAKIPFVTTFHAPYNFKLFLKKWYNGVMAKGDFMIANSDYVRNYAIKNYSIPSDKIKCIYRGLNIHDFDPTQISKQKIAAFKRKWNLPKDKKIIIMPARLTRWKGQEFLLMALRYVKSKDYCCVFIGGDQGRTKYKDRLLSYADIHDLSHKIHFIDHCTDMPTAYAASDFVLSLSLDPEAFGRVIIEAQAMGKAVILTDNGAAYENTIPNQTGFLIKAGDEKALAQTFENLLNQPLKDKANLAHIARNFVINNFNEEMMCVKTLQIYKKLL